MSDKYITIKILKGTRPTLRQISALTGESIMATVERLASAEKNRLGIKSKSDSQSVIDNEAQNCQEIE